MMNYLKNKSIVVPFDFSDLSRNAVDVALEMADESSSLHLIHVIQTIPTVVALNAEVPMVPIAAVETQQSIEEQLKELFGDGVYSRFERHCSVGDPGSEIVRLATDVGADLIVMPSHGRSGLSRLLIGSVAERVLRLANCPVLVLKNSD